MVVADHNSDVLRHVSIGRLLREGCCFSAKQRDPFPIQDIFNLTAGVFSFRTFCPNITEVVVVFDAHCKGALPTTRASAAQSDTENIGRKMVQQLLRKCILLSRIHFLRNT